MKILAILFLLACSLQAADTTNVPQGKAEGSAANDESQSLASALFTLADERYADVSARGETWILTLHDWFDNTNAVKITDGKFTVVSLPVIEPDRPGLEVYCDHYNAFDMVAADAMLKSGKTNEARQLYKLLRRYSAGPLSGLVQARLDCLSSLESGKGGRAELDTMIREDAGLGSIAKFRQVQALKSVGVTNLMSIQLSDFVSNTNGPIALEEGSGKNGDGK